MRRESANAIDVNEAGKAPAGGATGPEPDPSRISPGAHRARPSDPIDELVGSLTDPEPIDDIDAVIYEFDT